jgi:hypothetical protein
MEYFCYISRNKVDQLFQNDFSQYTETSIEVESGAAESIRSGSDTYLQTLFDKDITYGRKGYIQTERKVKMEYVDKLRKVLMAINKEKPIPSIDEALSATDIYPQGYYRYKGSFKVTDPLSFSGSPEIDSSKIISIYTTFLSYTLVLDCSLRFFSEGNDPKGKFHIHSGNNRFFNGEIHLILETVFILFSKNEKSLTGSPLFLKLSLKEGDFSLTI